jgi:hypothetical protein
MSLLPRIVSDAPQPECCFMLCMSEVRQTGVETPSPCTWCAGGNCSRGRKPLEATARSRLAHSRTVFSRKNTWARNAGCLLVSAVVCCAAHGAKRCGQVGLHRT